MKKLKPIAIAFLGIPIIGTYLIWIAATCAIGVSPDSTVYLLGALNILKGYGFSIIDASQNIVPITHYPPLFSLCLAYISKLGLDILRAAKILNSICFFSTILLLGGLLYKFTRSLIMSLSGQLLLAFSVNLLRIHSMAWTEPLFLCLNVAAFFSFACYLENEKKSSRLFLSALCIALALLTRYAGFTLFIAVLIGLILFSKKNRAQKLKNISLFCSICIGPWSMLLIHNALISGTVFNRTISFYSPLNANFSFILENVYTWIIQSKKLNTFRLVLILSCSAGIIWLLVCLVKNRMHLDSCVEKTIKIFALFILLYPLFIIFSYSFLDQTIPFDFRILSPLYIPTVCVLLCLLDSYLKEYSLNRFIIKLSLLIASILFFSSFLFHGIKWTYLISKIGQGYTNIQWQHSNIFRLLKGLPSDKAIYTNGRDVLYLYTFRQANDLPVKTNNITGQLNPKFMQNLNELIKKEAIIVYFNYINWRHQFPKAKEIIEYIPLTVLYQGIDGIIYTVDKNKSINFVEQAMSGKKIWALKNESTWLVSPSLHSNKKEVLPFWSNKKEVDSVAQSLAIYQYQPIEIPLNTFLNNYLPGIQKDKRLAGLNWDSKLKGREIPAQDLLNEFRDK